MIGVAPAARGLALWAIALTATLVVLACTRSSPGAGGAPQRIVSVGGPVTEAIYALGGGARVIAVDTTSVFPAAVTRLPQVGYQRQLSAEPILALSPDLVLASADAGPPAALEQLRAAGVRVAVMPAVHSAIDAAARVRAVATAIASPGGEALAASIERDTLAAKQRAMVRPASRRVLFLYGRGGGTVMIAGRATPADVMIGLAGARNAVDGFDGYKPLSAEAAVAAAPDVILVPSRGLEAIGGLDGLLALPGLAQTPAGQAGQVVAMDDLLLLGFGPRLASAIDELAQRLAGRSPSR